MHSHLQEPGSQLGRLGSMTLITMQAISKKDEEARAAAGMDRPYAQTRTVPDVASGPKR